ncbi:MAG TPA: hypothetical protein PLT31_01890 [Fibrobacteraceae bacterium]|nr:hypothetical protein [Fibrobacteraceae bacterium]
MNKKLFFGIISIAFIAGIFVACGEGAIEAYNTDDNVADLTFGNSLDIKKSETACQANPECLEKLNQVQPTSSAEPPPPSSSEEPVLISSSSVMFPTSSSSLITITSSTTIILPPSSSTIVIVSSSSVITPEGGLAGTCAPDPAIAELDTSVTWSFKKDPSVTPQQVIAASYDWIFEGASVETFSGQGTLGMKKTVSYNTSGPHTTSLSINGTAPIACTPVQVNGAKITGCKCLVDNASPDVAAGGVANWTVAGCASTANITGYTWNGGALGDVLTTSHTFAAKDETFTPTLTVSNDDNTVQVVACPAATAIDATKPDYEMTASGDSVTFEGNVDATIVMNLPETWHNGTTGTCTFACQVNRGGGSGAISGTVDKVDITGSDYVTAPIPITSTINGYALKLVVDVGTNAGVTCFVGW